MNYKHSPRLLIADSHRLFADACRQLLEPEFEVVRIVTDGRALVQAAMDLKPAGAILEIFMPQLNGLDAAVQIKRRLPSLKLVFTTTNSDPEVVADAFRRGASAYVLKQTGSEEFLTAIRRVMRGESYLSSLIAQETIQYLLRMPQNKAKGVTPRQSEILQLLVEGRSMKEVANILGISPGTVAFHKYNMMEGLGIGTNSELLQYAMTNHMIPTRRDWTITDAAGTRSMEPIKVVGKPNSPQRAETMLR